MIHEFRVDRFLIDPLPTIVGFRNTLSRICVVLCSRTQRGGEGGRRNFLVCDFLLVTLRNLKESGTSEKRGTKYKYRILFNYKTLIRGSKGERSHKSNIYRMWTYILWSEGVGHSKVRSEEI